MRIKQPFGIFFFVLYFSLGLKYFVHLKINSLHHKEVELEQLNSDLEILNEKYNLQVYKKLSKNNSI